MRTSAAAVSAWTLGNRTFDPSESGWSSSTMPLPLAVVATGASIDSASAATSAAAARAPPPATMTGREALRIASAARVTAWASRPGRRAGIGARTPLPGALEDVEGDLDVDRTRTGGREEGERLGDGLGRTLGGARALGGHEQVGQGPGGVLGLMEHADVGALEPGGHTGERMSIGRDSAYAVAAAVMTFVSPGPEVVMTTPGLPESRKYPSAP